MPNILITNDDGIHAPGLRALAAALAEVGTVTIVAPSRDHSAAAQSLTLRQPIYCDRIAEREYSIEGTPADAMILALHTLLDDKPDLVVSGINRGGNLGENIFYSGTVGAAMEGAINRVPAVAISVAYRRQEFDFAPAARVRAHARPVDSERRAAAGRAAQRQHPARLDRRGAHHAAIVEDHAQRPAAGRPTRAGGATIWLSEQQFTGGIEPDTDHAAIRDGAASVTPLRIDQTDTPSLEHLARWTKLLEATSRR